MSWCHHKAKLHGEGFSLTTLGAAERLQDTHANALWCETPFAHEDRGNEGASPKIIATFNYGPNSPQADQDGVRQKIEFHENTKRQTQCL